MMQYVESGTDYSHAVGYEYDTQNNLTRLVETINGVEHTTSYTYDDDNRVESVTNGAVSEHYTYDGFGRVSEQITKHNGTEVLTKYATFQSPDSGKTSAQVATYTIEAAGDFDVTYTYTYDDNGNITSISDGTNTTSYAYDSANQLIRENNQAAGFTHTWTYDDAGNILSRGEYAYTTGELEPPLEPILYLYEDGQWGDVLANYDDTSIASDAIGNITEDGSWFYTWEHGRQLASMDCGPSDVWTFTYNADGLRTKRTDGRTTYTYVYNGSQLVQMTKGNDTLHFTYDAAGTPATLTHNGTVYYYITNLQGDVVGILDSDGYCVVSYTYNAWGRPVSRTGSMASTLGTLNPLRYRGYVYDQETRLYYLQSRYYDPYMGRFLNADAFAATGQGLVGNNMFAYCNNNPVMFSDDSGTRPILSLSVATETAEERKASFSLANHVKKTHITTPTAMLNLGVLLGKVGFSSTVTKQNKEPGLVHSTIDVGNDASKCSVGVNAVGWLGADVGVSSEINAFISAQITPWFHGELSFGLDGIGAVIGFDVGDISYDFEINGGLGLIAVFVFPQILESYGQTSSAPTY